MNTRFDKLECASRKNPLEVDESKEARRARETRRRQENREREISPESMPGKPSRRMRRGNEEGKEKKKSASETQKVKEILRGLKLKGGKKQLLSETQIQELVVEDDD